MSVTEFYIWLPCLPRPKVPAIYASHEDPRRAAESYVEGMWTSLQRPSEVTVLVEAEGGPRQRVVVEASEDGATFHARSCDVDERANENGTVLNPALLNIG